MRYLAMVLLVVGCGESKKPAVMWKVGGIDVPDSVIPQTIDAPTALPKKIGDELLAGELDEMKTINEKLNVSYLYDRPHPNDDLVSGYKIIIYGDPVPDLAAKWGAGTDKSTDYGQATCWTATAKQLDACVPKGDGPKMWRVLFFTTAPAIDRPMTPIPPEPAGTYADAPVAVGPCGIVGIQEVSQIVGKQLGYDDPRPEYTMCKLLPATDKFPEVIVTRDPRGSWSKHPIEGLGEKAAWEDGTRFVQFQIRELVYRVRVNDPKRPVRWLKDRALQIAHKVAARVQALPAQ